MRSPTRRLGAVAAGLLLVFSACDGSDSVGSVGEGETQAEADTAVTSESAALAPTGQPLAPGIPHLVVVGPSSAGAGEVPTFSWEPVVQAASYDLVAFGPEGPLWAWEGSATEVTLGLPAQRAQDDQGPRIVSGSCWSVVALDGDGVVLAASELLPVSPGEADHECSPGSGPEA